MAIITGTAGADFLNGTSGDDIFRGFTGNDVLTGGAGNDIFQDGGSEGFDNISGGAGADKIVALQNYMYIGLQNFDPSSSVETITADGHYGVTIKNSISSTLDFSNTTLIGIDAIEGSTAGDVITGSAGSDKISTLGDNDFVNDSGGIDDIDGGTGKDIFSPGLNTNGQYVAQQSLTNQNTWTLINTGTIGLSSYSVALNSDGSRIVSGSDGRISNLQNFEVISYIGGSFSSNGDDNLSGATRAETIVGLSGNDTLTGGGGMDTLIGGTGADVFKYANVTDSSVGAADLIKDFTTLDGDKIDLSAIDANIAAAGDQAFNFIGTSAFSGATSEVRVEIQGDGNTHVYGSVGGTTPNFEIVLAGNITLQSANFVL